MSDNQPVLLNLFIQIYRLFIDFSADNFVQLIDDFFIHEEELAQDVASTIAANIMNFITRAIGNHRDMTEEKAMEYVKKIVASKYLEESGIFPADFFVNISILACSLEEVEWMEDFLKLGQRRLAIQSRGKTMSIASHYFLFAKKEFKEVWNTRDKINPKGIRENLQIKVLVLRALYEVRMEVEEYLICLLYTSPSPRDS